MAWLADRTVIDKDSLLLHLLVACRQRAATPNLVDLKLATGLLVDFTFARMGTLLRVRRKTNK